MNFRVEYEMNFGGCGFGAVVLEFRPKCINIMELCIGYDVTVCA